MSSIRDRLTETIRVQPEDATHEGMLGGLTFPRMVERGLADPRDRQVGSNEAMSRRPEEGGRGAI